MNFNFLSPSFLWALPLSLLPIVLHLTLKKPPRTVRFGDLRLLSEVLRRIQPRKRLQDWVLLLLRVLALSCLVLAFSRPVLHWGSSAGSDSMAVVILLDASCSMRFQESGRTNWDRSKDFARETLGALRENDRSCLIVFSDEVHLMSGPLSDRHRETAKVLEGLEPTYRGTRILPPLQAAYQLLENSGASNKAIVILSDLSRNGWGQASSTSVAGGLSAFQPLIPSYSPAVKILSPELPEMKDNVSVQALRLAADLRSQTLKAQADLRNWSDRKIPRVPVFLERLGAAGRSSESFVYLSGWGTQSAALSMPIHEGQIQGWVGKGPDGLAADDRFFFARPSIQKIRMLFVEERSGMAALSGESYFLRQAVAAPPSPFEVETVTLGGLKRLSADRFDLIALINPSGMDEETSEWLRRFTGGGRALFVSMGERAGRQPGLLRDLLPCDPSEIRSAAGQALRIVPGQDEALSGFANDYDWGKISMDRIAAVSLKDDAQSWIQLADGTPLLVVSGNGRTAVWCGAIDRSWGNFAGKPVFAPLFRFLLQKLTEKTSGLAGQGRVVGEIYQSRAKSQGGAAWISSPSGKKIELRVSGRDWSSPPLEEPGLYEVHGGPAEVFAVNVGRDSGESDGGRLTASDRKIVLPESSWKSLPSGDRYPAEFLSAMRGRELSRWFLLFAALFLLSESGLSALRFKRS